MCPPQLCGSPNAIQPTHAPKGEFMTVNPAATPTSPGSVRFEGSSAMFAHAFHGQWRPVYRSPLYRLTLLASALFMILVPLFYLAALGGVCWLTYWHFTHDTGLLHTRLRGRAVIVPLFIYVLPGILALAIIVFLLRPLVILFGVLRPDPNRVEIYPSEEPRLFAFVGMVCQVMGAPAPRRIFVDCRVNASAELMGGLLSFLLPNRLALHVGLPLVAGMSATNFAGVLAHEFGHFSQGAGMRATGLLHRMALWMQIAAYYRGGTEALVSSMLHSGKLFGIVMGACLGLCFWIARILLRITFFMGYAIAQFMGRRMEFDADAHAARFVGSKAAVDGWPAILTLGAAASDAERKVAEQWKNRTLPDDLPTLVATLSKRLSPDTKSHITRELESTTTKWSDSHPATGTRRHALTALAEPGIFRMDELASNLFTDFAGIAKRVSYNHFKERVGESIMNASFVPSEQIFGSHAQEEARAAGAESFLGFEPPDWRPLHLELEELVPADDPKKTWERVKQARAALATAGPAAAKGVDEFIKAERTFFFAAIAPAAFDLGVASLPKDFDFGFTTRTGLTTARASALDSMARSAAILDDAIDAAKLRLSACLRLLAVKGTEYRIPEALELRPRAVALLRAHAALRRAHAQIRTLRENHHRMLMIAHYYNEPKYREKAKEALRPVSDLVRDAVTSLRQDLGGTPAPFPGPDGTTNLGDLIVRATPAWREYDQILGAGSEVMERYPDVSRRVLRELVEIASRVEAGLGRSAKAATPTTPSSTKAATPAKPR
jgi:Zn-dependent protease with chaperone function